MLSHPELRLQAPFCWKLQVCTGRRCWWNQSGTFFSSSLNKPGAHQSQQGKFTLLPLPALLAFAFHLELGEVRG